MEAILRPPSSRAFNPWEFIVLDDAKILKDISKCRLHGSEFLGGASMAVAILGDTGRSDTCVEDCSIAAVTLQYAAQSLGLGSCWCQVRMRDHGDGQSAEEFIRKLLGIPGSYLVECIIGIGYPGERKEGHPRESLDWGKVHKNRYGTSRYS